MGMSQGANILGFGAHRALGLTGNAAGIGLSGTNNAIVANERVGVDSGLSAGRNGVDLGKPVTVPSPRAFPPQLPPPRPPPPPSGLGPSGWQTGVESPSRPHRIGTEGGFSTGMSIFETLSRKSCVK
ncbi:hypothetical protein COOONC_22197, partial [Cooperia oncophora]